MPNTLPIHPRTGLQAVGIVAGKPVWPILGGDGTGDGGSTGGSGGGSPAGGGDDGGQGDPGNGQSGGQGGGSNPPADGTGGQPASGQQGAQGGQEGGSDDELANVSQADLAKMVRDLRGENAKNRTGAKEQAATEARDALAQKIGKELGLVKDDEPADPDKLAEQLSAEQQRAKDSTVELAIYKTAGKHGADPDALADSRTFLNKIAELDPTSKTFQEDVGKAVEAATKDNPKLRAQGQAPPRSSGQHAGGTGGNQRPKSVTEALNRHYKQ